jgi:hypothetical protein
MMEFKTNPAETRYLPVDNCAHDPTLVKRLIMAKSKVEMIDGPFGNGCCVSWYGLIMVRKSTEQS